MIPAIPYPEIPHNPYGYVPGWDRFNDVPVWERIERREREPANDRSNREPVRGLERWN